MNAIVMMDYDHTIGINGDQIIHIPDDLKNKVLCLPYYGNLGTETLEFICGEIKNGK